MADKAESGAAPDAPKKKSKMPLLIGLVLGLASAGGGFFAASGGMLPFGGGAKEEAGEEKEASAGESGSAGGSGAHGASEQAEGGTAEPSEEGEASGPGITYAEDASFVPMDPIILALGSQSEGRHLKFTVQIEVTPGAEDAIANLSPRILDIMNTYLRAVGEEELAEDSSLIRIRMHLLRRIQVIAGADRVRDVLITEFVLT